jgi:hypothetical protein
MKTKIICFFFIYFASMETTFSQIESNNHIFVDSLWGYSLAIPKNYIGKRVDKYQLNIIPKIGSLDGFTCSMETAKQFLASLISGGYPKFVAESDSIKQIVLLLANRVKFIKTAESNVNCHIDSVLEQRTDYGLRAFTCYETQVIDYYEGSSETFHLAPFFIVAIPAIDDHVFFKIELNDDEPSANQCSKIWNIVKSIRSFTK